MLTQSICYSAIRLSSHNSDIKLDVTIRPILIFSQFMVISRKRINTDSSCTGIPQCILFMDKHVSISSLGRFLSAPSTATCQRSVDSESAATLVHAFVTYHIDYCNVLLAGAPKATTDKLQRFLNESARHLVCDTRKFDRGLRQIMHVDLHSVMLNEDKFSRPRTRPRTKLRGRGQGRGQFSNTKDHL